MTGNDKKTEDEIDLVRLFSVLGRSVKGFILQVFNGIFNTIISLLLFFRKNGIIFCISIFLGGVIGLFLQARIDNHYKYTMVLEPHLESIFVLSENINYYNHILEDSRYDEIASILNISLEEAEKINYFSLEPNLNKKNTLELYDSFRKSIDTVVSNNNLSFDEFKSQAFIWSNSKYYTLVIMANSKDLGSGIGDAILNKVRSNKKLLRDQRELINVLEEEAIDIRNTIISIDSLKKTQNKALLLSAENYNQSSLPFINLGSSSGNQFMEIKLLQYEQSLKNKYKDIMMSINESSVLVSTISALRYQGLYSIPIYSNVVTISIATAILLVLLCLIFINLNRYLIKHEQYKG